MTSDHNSSKTAQVVEIAPKVSGNPRTGSRKRLPTRHIPDQVRARISALMCIHEDCDRVADVMSRQDGIKGITGKTVLEVLVCERLPKPPASAVRRVFAMRRSA